MQKPKLKIVNGNIITPNRIIRDGCILIDGERIVEVSSTDIDAGHTRTIDAGGMYVAPGFIDIHVHGGGGHDFMDGDVQGFISIAELHTRYGTTSMLPTTLTSTKEEMFSFLDVYSEAQGKNPYAEFLGIHLEGPYFDMDQRGAQDPRFIRDPDPAEYERIIERSPFIKRWSAAPERKGALEFGRFLVQKNILPSLAHTSAVYDDVVLAYENGYTLATHLYSGMLGTTRRNAYRYAGAVESAFLIDGMYVEIIADGKHLPAPLLKLIFKIKGAARVALITDAMRAAGVDCTESMLGSSTSGMKVIVEDGVAKVADRTSFAGSVATCDRLVRSMIDLAEVPLTDAVRMMTLTPAEIMNVQHRKGSLVAGKDADVVIFNDRIEVDTTIVKGRVVHSRSHVTDVT